MWLKTKIGKRVGVTGTHESSEWEGTLVEVDAVGLTVNDVETGLTFIPLTALVAVRVIEA